MKVYVKWTVDPKEQYEIIDSVDWDKLPKKKLPIGRELIDDEKGWIYEICIMGITYHADHYCVIDKPDYVKVIHWNDDPEDYTPDQYWAREWKIYPMIIRKDGKKIPHIERISYNSFESDARPYSEFIKPDEKITRHGIWVPNEMIKILDDPPPPKYTEWR